ncbi:MAG: glycosyltransferase family 39 protein [Deltaproteobacteria bacterium]|nr:glycosyltransferase family 39 protein [Deltaproteobacteria bacterium]MBK8715833.1 glycosyltransferase family 39 protein [Deltaproteobacteria bacterium]MBP7286563.1 glycosyltransferase family 39 protein [Nannocystaceae bacterium]
MSDANPALPRTRRLWIAALLGLLTTLVLARASVEVGYVRDEGIYFAASRQYAAWAAHVVREPGKALARAERDRYFRINHEHPALLKLLAGVSALAFAQPPQPGTAEDGIRDDGGMWPIMTEGAAMRLPAQALAGLGVALLFATAAAWGGVLAGLLAAGAFALLPHVAFHAQLHAFDVPVAVAMLAVVLAYRAAQRSRGWGIAAGVVLGVAIAIKHNALFLGPLLALHHAVTLLHARRRGHVLRWRQWLPLSLVSMAILGPLVAWLLWPWLWAEPVARIGEYFAFHRQHAYYNMEFLGTNYNQPPMPIAYPFVMTLATVPSVIVALAIAGAVVSVRDELAAPGNELAAPGNELAAPGTEAAAVGSAATPLPPGWPRGDGLLLLIMALFPLLLIAWPTTPIFGGTKHWITAYPFVALLAARAWIALWRRVEAPRWRPWLALLLCLAPGAIATVDAHPFGMSQYGAVVGGARGGARLGLGRGFWGHAIARELPELPTWLGRARRLYVHDVHELAVLQYRREGRWPAGIESVPLARAQAGLVFHELHMATWEYQLWEQLGEVAPTHVVTLDGVPLTSVYVDPRARR